MHAFAQTGQRAPALAASLASTPPPEAWPATPATRGYRAKMRPAGRRYAPCAPPLRLLHTPHRAHADTRTLHREITALLVPL